MLAKVFVVLQAVVLVVSVLGLALAATWLQIKEEISAEDSVGS